MRVYLDVAPWALRSRRMDWRYVRFLLPQLSQWDPQLEMVTQRSPWVTLAANLKTLRHGVGKHVGLPLGLRALETDRLDTAELRRSRCDVVFSHRGYPLNVGSAPLVWMSSILDPEMVRSYTGLDDAALQPENELRHEFFARSAAVQVCTLAESARLARTFPELAGRFVPVPFFLPYLQPQSVEPPEPLLARHRGAQRIEFLFVGNEPRRKGLDLLLEAFLHLPEPVLRRAHLTVVSNFDGANVALPASPHVTVLRGLPHDAVLALMRRAHVLVNAARFESYGLIFPEAMAHGMVCVGPHWEVQRELLDGAGVTVSPSVEALLPTLIRLIEDEVYRAALAEAGLRRFRERYAPAVVARQYAELFLRVARA